MRHEFTTARLNQNKPTKNGDQNKGKPIKVKTQFKLELLILDAKFYCVMDGADQVIQ